MRGADIADVRWNGFAYFACALWVMWAAPPLAAQRAVLSGPDADFFEAYRRSDPITKWPLNQIKSRIPELNGLKPATDQSQLPGILRGVSENLQKFTTNFVNVAATESVDEPERPRRPREGWDAWGDERLGYEGTTERTVQKFRYLVMGRKEGEALTLIEYRTDLHGREAPTQKLLSKQYVKTTGFAAMPLFFGPLEQPWSYFRLLGQQKMAGCRTPPPLNPLLNEEGTKGWCEVVAFAEHAEPVAVMGHFLIGGTSVPLLVQGVAWIRSSDYQILKMRTDLLGPLGALKGVTTVVLFARNQFQGIPTVFWLPQEVRVYIALGNVLLSNRHKYSDYRLFKVKSVIKTDFPAAQQH